MTWQNNLSWEEQFELLGADGIDFHSPMASPPFCSITDSFTKEEFLKGVAYPRSAHTFWKMIGGYKCYLNMTNETETKPKHKVFINAPVEYLIGHLRYGHYEGTIELTDEEFEEFKKNPADYCNHHNLDLDILVDDYSIDEIGELQNWEQHNNVKIPYNYTRFSTTFTNSDLQNYLNLIGKSFDEKLFY